MGCYDYDTIGGVYNDVYSVIFGLTEVEKIWTMILEVVAVGAEQTGADKIASFNKLYKR